jgi:hypothetical protein
MMMYSEPTGLLDVALHAKIRGVGIWRKSRHLHNYEHVVTYAQSSQHAPTRVMVATSEAVV